MFLFSSRLARWNDFRSFQEAPACSPEERSSVTASRFRPDTSYKILSICVHPAHPRIITSSFGTDVANVDAQHGAGRLALVREKVQRSNLSQMRFLASIFLSLALPVCAETSTTAASVRSLKRDDAASHHPVSMEKTVIFRQSGESGAFGETVRAIEHGV